MNPLLHIINFDFKESVRSPLWHRKLVINLFLILTFVYLAGNFLVLGIFLDDILIKIPLEEIDFNTYGRSFVLRRLDQFLIYYFFFDFIIRYFMQKLPAMSVQPYLHLPIKRSSLVHFMLLKSIWSPFNLIHFLIFIPFMFELFENLDFMQAFGWSSGFTLLVFASNYFLLLIKRTSDVDARVYVGMLASLISILALDWFDAVDFQALSGLMFDALFLHPWTLVVPLILIAVTYGLNFNFLKANMYLSKLSKVKKNTVSYSGNGVLSRFGLVGRLTELEFKFIWRNKRSKSVFMMTFLFLGYGLFIFPNPEYAGNYLMYVLFSIVITGMFMMNYGQYLLGWEGSYFDHLLTRNVSFKDYYMSKFLLFAIVGGGSMILSIPYAYFGWEVLVALFCVFLFNMGVSSHMVMFFGSMNPKKIDLSQSTVFNWQGFGAAQFLMVIPVLVLPLAIFGLGYLIWGNMGGILFLGAVGLLSLAGTKYWISLLAKWLTDQRYNISNDFRNQ